MNSTGQGRISKPHFSPGEKDSKPADVAVRADSGLSFKARIWMEKEGETFLSFARITLLERIREHGSITQAARSMNISYRHAWKLVESMNRLAISPLVSAATGGKGGGGAVVTEEGEKAITLFHRMHDRMRQFVHSAQSEAPDM